jgi:flagellar basal-body rod modification protein FlgD
MATSVNSITGSSAMADSPSAAALSGSKPPTQQMFLQLLVAQIKNQDPLNPTDSVQFVSQLAQFSQLEQVIAIRSDLEAQGAASTPATDPTPKT